ncbi:amidohydrolase family protein [Telmatocola sphagniphila]|uniref:Amidohydrolase family protein n=1 Tax=Telmatocola sphagniphila TaxID=1123043 RepID=A0A8E6B846_9BACT|nr:amidohydrolase family protein [Telmatocola sphagniphila]QVL33107.1 amidohydrolase family protein [Telmatocola sphagniphila]
MSEQKPEYNVTGQDYTDRRHFRYSGPPLIDIHSHVTMTAPSDGSTGAAGGSGREGSTEQAEVMLSEAREFGIARTVTMCPVQDIAPLREKFGDALVFNGMINKKKIDDSDDEAYKSLDAFLAEGIKILKLWSAPRGRERGLVVNAPWRIESIKRAIAAGVQVVMVHVGDPDNWWNTVYKETAKFGTKADQYLPFREMLERFPEVTWIGAHMGGNPEHPDELQRLLEDYPHLCLDTSATKWQVREISRHPEAIRNLITKFPDRFMFGSDLVTRYGLHKEHYTSRYWCQRTLFESHWSGTSPIADGDYVAAAGEPALPALRGIELPEEVLLKVYRLNALRILG